MVFFNCYQNDFPKHFKELTITSSYLNDEISFFIQCQCLVCAVALTFNIITLVTFRYTGYTTLGTHEKQT